MKRQSSVSKGSLSRMFQAAADSWKQQNYQQSIDILQRASQFDHANTRILLDLGRAHGMRYDYTAAEQCFEKAIRLAGRKTEMLVAAGYHCHEFGRYEMAGKYFERAAEQTGASTEVFVKLAELYERQHRQDDAARMVDRALNLDATYAPALLARARQGRVTGDLDEAEKILRTFLAKPQPNGDTWTRVRAWYELGGILDRQTRYDEAMSAFLEAKALLRPGAAKAAAALQGVQARVKEMENTISASVLQRWAESVEALQPKRNLALLCGHPRSGTTLLEQVLDSHPEILSAEETHILHDEAYLPLSRGFSPETSLLTVLDSAPMSLLQQSRENYFKFTELLLGKTIGDKLLIDKNPSLNVLIPAVIRIFPEAKFLVALRDPRDVCLSCFMQPLTINPVSSSYLTLEGTVTEYESVMGFWKTILPRMKNPYIEVRYEDMVADLEPQARRVLDFLGVPWDKRVLRFDEHARSKLVRSPTYADVAKPIFKGAVGRWKNYQKHLEPWLDKLAPFAKDFGYE